jgi:glucose-6-phosphate isomerase
MAIQYQARLTRYEEQVASTIRHLESERTIERIWQRDHRVWKPEPAEISNRLGWLDIANRMLPEVPGLLCLLQKARGAGFTRAVLLGMGGSSLAPEMFAKTLGRPCYLKLSVMDSTDPGAVLALAARLQPEKTLFIVSTKSGGTVETFSLGKFYYTWMAERVGASRAGKHFWAITDPGSALIDWAQGLGFGEVLLADPNIGGRYSALSMFGLLPAALVGADVERLLNAAASAAAECSAAMEGECNPALCLGAAVATLALAGRDKLTLFTSPSLASFGDWVEQLVAESLGKEGRGVVPVVGEAPAEAKDYGQDRLFVGLRLPYARPVSASETGRAPRGHPSVDLHLRDRYELGAQILLWELATAVAAIPLGVNPFDQPNVEAAKVLARKVVGDFRASGSLPSERPALSSGGLEVYGDTRESSPERAWTSFVDRAPTGAYMALQAYLPPTPATSAALLALRLRVRKRRRLATTAGYGPRFLHSTGQMHKGDGGNGWFVQFTADDARDAAIPDEAGKSASSISFGVLKQAQAAGDWQALREANRHAIRFHLGKDVRGGLERLLAALQ